MKTSRNLAQTLRQLADRLDAEPEFSMTYDEKLSMRPTISMSFGSNVSSFKAAVKVFLAYEMELSNFTVTAFREDGDLAVSITGNGDYLTHPVKQPKVVEHWELNDDVRSIFQAIAPAPLDKPVTEA